MTLILQCCLFLLTIKVAKGQRLVEAITSHLAFLNREELTKAAADLTNEGGQEQSREVAGRGSLSKKKMPKANVGD